MESFDAERRLFAIFEKRRLEDQFNPDEYTKDDLLAYLEKQASNSYSSMEKKMAIEVLKVLSE